MKDKDSGWIVIGRLGRPHGVKGLITVNSFTQPSDNLLTYEPLYYLENDEWRPLPVLSFKIQHQRILIEITGCTDRDGAANWTNIAIGIKKEQLPSLTEGEYYWIQLIGMKVVNQQNSLLGILEEIIPTGSNDVLVVIGKKRYLIPYLPGQFVLHIDEQKKLITVDWDEDF